MDENENLEAPLVERPAMALFGLLGYEVVDAFNENQGFSSALGRNSRAEVVLVPRLRAALRRLNAGVPDVGIEQAVEELTRARDVLTVVYANREVYWLLKNGVPVTWRDERGEEARETVRVIDWEQPQNNDFLLVSQLWVTGTVYTKRPDLVGFVNGLPLVVCEFKASHVAVEEAYEKNIGEYKVAIPQLFWYNALIILSNGTESVLGSVTAGLEHYVGWKKVESEEEEEEASLETMLRGVCEKRRLLDIVENFTLFSDVHGPLVKLVAKNHQYLGVNNAIAAVRAIREKQGKLGVFWHTQGSGKSVSMIFFMQKVLRTIPGDWTFVVVTDRDDLDRQIYKNFAGAGAVIEPEEEVWAADGEHLKSLLRGNHRVVFTLIHKFRTAKGATYEKLSERANIIVMTDEAHRTEYGTLAANMRSALPNAAFIGFTGTPLLKVGEEKTREVFGDYVSIYNFRRSVEDGTTVPLYYENRAPLLKLVNPDLNEAMERILDEGELDDQQEQQLEREYVREYSLITSDDRLEKIAEDIVAHFMGRGRRDDKAMVVSIDKITTVRMYDKVQKYWRRYRAELETRLAGSTDEAEKRALRADIAYMMATDRAVVVSETQGEIEKFRKKGLDIILHRERMKRQKDLDEQFKDAENPLRMVFVCAMWITGFDVPSLGTVYLDKPMRNHTLMQAIARANRVFLDKSNGLIVDYAGVFRDLQKALAIYGSESGGGIAEGDTPVQDKSELFDLLKDAVVETLLFCKEQGFDAREIVAVTGLERVASLKAAENALVRNDDIKRMYLALARHVAKLYKAVLPYPDANEYKGLVDVFVTLVARIGLMARTPGMGRVREEVEKLLGSSIVTREFVIREVGEYDDGSRVDLSKIDFEALRERFVTGFKHSEIEKLRGAIREKLDAMVRLNKSRTNYVEKFQRLIDEYNAGSSSAGATLENLIQFITQELNVEEQRHIAEQLSEEELAIFDLLKQPGIALSRKEEEDIKQVVRELLKKLKDEKLVLDWRKKQQAQAAVQKTIQDMFYRALAASYGKDAYQQACASVYQHVYDSYYGMGRSVYANAS